MNLGLVLFAGVVVFAACSINDTPPTIGADGGDDQAMAMNDGGDLAGGTDSAADMTLVLVPDLAPDLTPDLTPDFTGAPTFALTVMVTGSGTVTSSPAGINCSSGSCVGMFPNQMVTLTATPTVGNYLRSWSGDCSGRTTCTVTVSQARNVTATFVGITNNLVFVSSASYATTLGSARAYDTPCNQLATAAGINSQTNDAYVAYVTDQNSDAVTVLGSARGFMRVDGAPFADSLSGLVNMNKVLNTLSVDEKGATVSNGVTLVGASNPALYSCSNWTSTAGNHQSGTTSWGPGAWHNGQSYPCSGTYRLFCFMKTQTAALSFTPATGKKIYLSNSTFAVAGGIAAADAKCDADKPMGTAGAVKALLATTTTPAGAVLTAGANYVRPDGVLVGTGAELVAGTLRSGIWQSGNGLYGTGYVFNGSTSSSAVGTASTTCQNWTSALMSDHALLGYLAQPSNWWGQDSVDCSNSYPIYCVEQ